MEVGAGVCGGYRAFKGDFLVLLGLQLLEYVRMSHLTNDSQVKDLANILLSFEE